MFPPINPAAAPVDIPSDDASELIFAVDMTHPKTLEYIRTWAVRFAGGSSSFRHHFILALWLPQNAEISQADRTGRRRENPIPLIRSWDATSRILLCFCPASRAPFLGWTPSFVSRNLAQPGWGETYFSKKTSWFTDAVNASKRATIGSLRYFSSDNQDFADVGCYCAVIQPARITPTLEVYSQELAPLDYHFFGDIIILLGSPDTLNIRTHATVHVCGVSSNIDKPNSTFDIEAEQYLSATKTPDNGFPVHCVFPATPRGEKYKPIPGKGKSVSVEGFLTGLELNDDRSVTFLGNASSTAPKAEESPTRIVNTCTPARLKFTLEVKLPVVPALPNPKKRKLIDQQANEPQDKGEGTSTGHRSGGGANKH
ncbi:hypothetical protein R3P38DRAFT_2812209 [Favolaschia claudopus]|uniref:Uncharacterized protein n=1 Tax=Favolaschia claudopus TaxID=2862362 RepID=A0AAV9Z784_9AGAR